MLRMSTLKVAINFLLLLRSFVHIALSAENKRSLDYLAGDVTHNTYTLLLHFQLMSLYSSACRHCCHRSTEAQTNLSLNLVLFP